MLGGSFGYMAPELFHEDAKRSEETDIYAFAIIVYEVVTGIRTDGRYRIRGLPTLITPDLRPIKPEDPVAIGFGSGTWEFIEKCWDGNCESRPTAGGAAEHFEWIAATSTDIDPGPIPWAHSVGDEAPSQRATARRTSVSVDCHRFCGFDIVQPF